MELRIVTDKDLRKTITRAVLEALPEWFEVEESREQYISDSVDRITVAAFEGDKPIGFLSLKETGRETVELAVMGVLKEYHRSGIGRKLFELARGIARENGYEFMQVKTVKLGVYEDYDRTNKFYLSLGFKEFEMFPLLWDEANPCQVYVMSL